MVNVPLKTDPLQEEWNMDIWNMTFFTDGLVLKILADHHLYYFQ